MAISVHCSTCGHSYKVDEKFVGQRVKCKNCGNAFIIDASPSSVPLSADPFAEASFQATLPKAPERPAKWKLPPVTVGEDPAPASAAATPSFRMAYRYRGRLGRDVRTGVDPLTPYLLMLQVAASIIFGVYISVGLFADHSWHHGSELGHVWGWIALSEILFFAVVGPLMLLGLWATAKIFSFPLVDSPYWRACGAAAIPAIACYFILIASGALQIFGLILIVPLAFLSLKRTFDLDWQGGAAGFIFGMAGFIFGCVATVFLIGLFLGVDISAMAHSGDRSNTELASTTQPGGAGPGVSSNAGSSDQNASAHQNDPSGELSHFRDLVNSKTSRDVSQLTRDEVAPEALELRRQLDRLAPACHNSSEWPALADLVLEFEKKVNALPPSGIDPAIFTDPPDAEDWTLGSLSRAKLAEEVSFKGFKFQPPLEAKIDLRSSEDADEGIAWNPTATPSRLMIYSRPRTDTRQRRPIVSDSPIVLRAAERQGLLTVDASHVMVTFGLINEIPCARVATDTNAPGGRWIRYFFPSGEQWIVIRVIPPVEKDNPFAKVLEASARTVRKMDPGEAKADPFAPAIIAPRLLDDLEGASALLRKQGPVGEEAVALQLKATDSLLRRRALDLLQDIGTQKSLPALEQAASDPDPTFSGLARDAIHRIQSATTKPTPNP